MPVVHLQDVIFRVDTLDLIGHVKFLLSAVDKFSLSQVGVIFSLTKIEIYDTDGYSSLVPACPAWM
jgi:hypothetical protein